MLDLHREDNTDRIQTREEVSAEQAAAAFNQWLPVLRPSKLFGFERGLLGTRTDGGVDGHLMRAIVYLINIRVPRWCSDIRFAHRWIVLVFFGNVEMLRGRQLLADALLLSLPQSL